MYQQYTPGNVWALASSIMWVHTLAVNCLCDCHVHGRGSLWALATTSTLLNNPSCEAYLDIEPSVLAEMLLTLHLQKLKHSMHKIA